MANTIQHKRSTTASSVPSAGQLAVGELALNLTDKKIYSKDGSGNVVEMSPTVVEDGSITTAKIADANVTIAKLSATGTPSSSTYLRGDGSWQSAGGGLQTSVFVSSTTWTVPAGVTSIRVTAVGGGGGGGKVGGGGNGGVAIGVYTVTPGTTYTVTVGAGGGAANTGGTGGESWFGVNSSAKLLYATGGIGGSSTVGGNNTDGTGYLGTLRNTGNKEGSGVIGGSWPRRAGSGTGALSYTVSTAYMPGCGGQGATTDNFNAGGGVGGVVLVEYVG